MERGFILAPCLWLLSSSFHLCNHVLKNDYICLGFGLFTFTQTKMEFCLCDRLAESKRIFSPPSQMTILGIGHWKEFGILKGLTFWQIRSYKYCIQMHIVTWSFIIQQSVVGNSWESTFRMLEMAAVSPDYWVLSSSTRTAICDDRNLLIMGSRMTGCQEQSGTKLEGGWNRAARVKEILVINFVWFAVQYY